ncbi:MAG: acyltransferase [Bacteroides sp.]|nr:acyltransferase [Bacteroides sp.]
MTKDQLITPPHLTSASGKKPRNSNLELYRIIVMLLIVAHHYVVNSGLIGVIQQSDNTLNSAIMLLFGAWGKTGINCFVLITGYFMCKSQFSFKKLLKLYLQIAFYAMAVYLIFCITGHETFSPFRALWMLWPAKSIALGFTSCFLIFYMFIPVLNVLVNAMDKRLHSQLTALIIIAFSILPSFPMINMTHNYVTWFIALYLIASYIRMYGLFPNISHRRWGWLALLTFSIGSASVLCMYTFYKMGFLKGFQPYFFVADSNKFLSLAIAVCSFMYFKDLKIGYSRYINLIGASTFGVLLIHANSDAMRQWLWRDTVDCIGHFNDFALNMLGYALLSVLIIFCVCSAIDCLRAKYIEPKLIDFIYDKSRTAIKKIQPA